MAAENASAVPPERDGVVLRTENLVRRYGPDMGVHGVDLAVPARGVYGLVGPNGAGKSTLLGMISGLRRADSGRIDLSIPRDRVALVPDVPDFETWLSAAEVVALSASLVRRPVAPDAVAAALAEVGLEHAAHRRVGGFSRGMSQRLALAAARVTDPQLYLLDEPNSALDPAGRVMVLDLVRRWGRNAAVVLSSHVLADVQRAADSVAVIRDGRLAYQGPLRGLVDGYVRPTWRVRLRGSVDDAQRTFADLPWVRSCETVAPDEIRVLARSQQSGEREIVATLSALGAPVVSVQPEEADLESAFMALTDGPAA